MVLPARCIDPIVNRISFCDDKLVITFSHTDGAKTITRNHMETALAGEWFVLLYQEEAVRKDGLFFAL